mgnify:CR=1 FL=1
MVISVEFDIDNGISLKSITNDIKSRYNDVYNDKCQVAIEEDIRTEICDYLDKYVECYIN